MEEDNSESNNTDILEVVRQVTSGRDDNVKAKEESIMNPTNQQQESLRETEKGSLLSQAETMDARIREKSLTVKVVQSDVSATKKMCTVSSLARTSENDTSPIAPPSLRRQAPGMRQQVLDPGAYPLGGDYDLSQEESESPTPNEGTGIHVPNTAPPPTSEAPDDIASAGKLAKAIPVKDDCLRDLEAAEPVDLEAVTARRKANAKKQTGIVFLFGFIVAAIVGIVLAVTLATRDKSSHPNVLTATPAPTLVTTTESPTEAPTSPLDDLKQDLPVHTLESLADPATPQSHAMRWLSSHPELPNMTLWRQKQLLALGSFFYAMDGPHWREEIRNDWMLYDKHECFWFSSEYGLFVEEEYVERDECINNGTLCLTNACTENEELVLLDLNGLQLQGRNPHIPVEIELLPRVRVISLHECDIEAPIHEFLPTTLYQMSSLNKLHLQSNALTGPVPEELQTMENVTDINILRNHHLSGSLSSLLPLTLKRLDMLDSGTGFGSIPTWVGLLDDLVYLDVARNGLTGTLPTELSQPPKLERIYAYQQNLTGPLPTQLGLMPSLVTFQAHDNAFSGELPSELGLMPAMERIRLGFNGFIGSLPPTIADMKKLNWLELQHNQLSGPVPSQLPKLEVLFLDGNLLTGSLTSSVGQVDMLQYLVLNDNLLTGSLPTQLGQLTSVEWLHLHHNRFSSSIPWELGTANRTIYLTLGSNALTGQLPSQLGLLRDLVELDLSNNPLLNGTLPVEVAALADLESGIGSLLHLNISGTGISGTIPDKLCALNNHNGTCTFALDPWWAQYDVWLDAAEPKDCGLFFDCSELLCGCDCPCAS